jgi:hypothetical protein
MSQTTVCMQTQDVDCKQSIFTAHEPHPDPNLLASIRDLVPSKNQGGIYRKVIEGRPNKTTYPDDFVNFFQSDPDRKKTSINQPTYIAMKILEKHPEIVKACKKDDLKLFHSSATANSTTAGAYIDALMYRYGIGPYPGWTIVGVVGMDGATCVGSNRPFATDVVKYNPISVDYEQTGRDLQQQLGSINKDDTFDVIFNNGCISQPRWSHPSGSDKKNLDDHAIDTFETLPYLDGQDIGDSQHKAEWGIGIDIAMAVQCAQRLRIGGHATTKIRRFESTYMHILAGLFAGLFERVAIYPVSNQICRYAVVVGESAKHEIGHESRLKIIESMQALHKRDPSTLCSIDTTLLNPRVMDVISAVWSEMEWDKMRVALMTHNIIIKRLQGKEVTADDLEYDFNNNKHEQSSVKYVRMREEMIGVDTFLQSVNNTVYRKQDALRMRIVLSRMKVCTSLSHGIFGTNPTQDEINEYIQRYDQTDKRRKRRFTGPNAIQLNQKKARR